MLGPADALHPRCPSSTWRPADADSNAKFFMRFTQFRHVFLWFCGFALHFNFGLKEVDIVLCKSESIVCETILANSKNAEPTMPTRTEPGQNDNLRQRKGNDSSGTRAKSWRLGRSGVLEMYLCTVCGNIHIQT